ncbi:AraC family transcriptional regulator [Aquibacillus sediminis]|uniref:AraC family transcriptional regulator n=1 Tax=Aquibacillus sediminis TaxID=2574734 RepID=UPI001108208E|nr:AraC family transcriptional regulator [Aquibacillus sediminis]
MEQSNIVSAAVHLNILTELNIYVLDPKGDFIYQHAPMKIPPFMPGANEADIIYFFNEMQLYENRHQLYAFANEWGLNYLSYTFEKGETYTVVIGPYLELTSDIYRLARRYNLNNHEREELKTFCNQIQVLNPEKINSLSSILQLFDRFAVVETLPTTITADGNELNNNLKAHSQTDDDAEIINMRYKIETSLIHAVEQGNKSKAKVLFHSNNGLFAFSERLPNQPLRRHKNLNVILNSLLRSAAVRKQVPPVLIHRISEQFAYKIERANQLIKLQNNIDQMIESYCDLIITNSLNSYSTMTKKVIEHLMSFYDRRVDKNELAALCNTHPNHLSRKFKQETNKTIIGYQQMIRIDKAKHLLKNESLSIEEIAWLIGYEDSSYFSRVFKKETGFTPSLYKEAGV